MRKGKGSGMERLFSFGILVGRRENIVFERSFVHLRPDQPPMEAKHVDVTNLSDRPSANWGLINLLKDLIQWAFEYSLKHSFGVPKGMGFSFRMEASQTLTK
jgi:hypothetical protein